MVKTNGEIKTYTYHRHFQLPLSFTGGVCKAFAMGVYQVSSSWFLPQRSTSKSCRRKILVGIGQTFTLTQKHTKELVQEAGRKRVLLALSPNSWQTWSKARIIHYQTLEKSQTPIQFNPLKIKKLKPQERNIGSRARASTRRYVFLSQYLALPSQFCKPPQGIQSQGGTFKLKTSARTGIKPYVSSAPWSCRFGRPTTFFGRSALISEQHVGGGLFLRKQESLSTSCLLTPMPQKQIFPGSDKIFQPVFVAEGCL